MASTGMQANRQQPCQTNTSVSEQVGERHANITDWMVVQTMS